jgi:diacylglycerol kinase family enzyme
MRIGVLNNVRAGRNPRRIERVRAFLTAHREIPHVETESGAHVREALSFLAQKEVNLLVVNGGDGTLQRALSEILSRQCFAQLPLVAPLRGGRTNMNALDIGSQRNPVTALAALLHAARNGGVQERLVDRAVLRVAFDDHAAAHYGMCMGVGLVCRAVELTHRLFPEGRAQGVFGSTIVIGTLVSRLMVGAQNGILRPDAMQIRLDGQPLQGEKFLLGVATTLERLFLKISPFWGREPAGVRFTAITGNAKRPLLAVPGILYGRPPASITPEAGYTSRNVNEVELRLDCGLVLDGEMFSPQPNRVVRISADKRVRFVRA